MTDFSPPPEFERDLLSLDVALDREDLHRMTGYVQALLEANQRFNLTAVTDVSQVWRRHVLDSLSVMPLLVSADAKRVVDVGSGGGLPGIPLAIAMADVHFTLLEATGKKARFLHETAGRLELPNVTVINQRAETLGAIGKDHRDLYDVVLARAVGRLPVLLELTVPLAKVGGLVLAMKGAQAEAEISEARPALHLLHAHVIDRVPTCGGVIVVVEKQRPTPRAYPRPPGEPTRSPLGAAPTRKNDARRSSG